MFKEIQTPIPKTSQNPKMNDGFLIDMDANIFELEWYFHDMK